MSDTATAPQAAKKKKAPRSKIAERWPWLPMYDNPGLGHDLRGRASGGAMSVAMLLVALAQGTAFVLIGAAYLSSSSMRSIEFGAFSYAIETWSNERRTVIGYDGKAYAKLNWTWTDDGAQLWYCTAAFGEATAIDAESAKDADDADPANGGCGDFPWSALDPA